MELTYRQDVVLRSLTNARGWANISNQLRFSEEAPVRDIEEFLPIALNPKDDEKKTDLHIPKRTKAIAQRLENERKLPHKFAIVLTQLGVIETKRG